MYIYAPHIDAFLCYNRSKRKITFEKMEDAMSNEWENWDEEEDEHGTRRIFYLHRGKHKMYLCWAYWMSRTEDRRCVIVNYRPGCNSCFIRDNQLFFGRSSLESVVVPAVRETYFRCVKKTQTISVVLTDATHVEMMCILPHCLK